MVPGRAAVPDPIIPCIGALKKIWIVHREARRGRVRVVLVKEDLRFKRRPRTALPNTHKR
jgi:hypothetical protein